MPKLKSDPITSLDLENFVRNNSDFDFEMKVLAKLRSLDFDCEHSGTYQDPITSKVRQFDIRAKKSKGAYTLALAVECKNIRVNHPLLLSAVPRSITEAAHEYIMVNRMVGTDYPQQCSSQGERSVYKEGEMVGKKIDQVGCDNSGQLLSDDQATFDKINQAVNSCKDLIKNLRRRVFDLPRSFGAIVPVLVVPDGSLWQVDYDQDGVMKKSPRRVDRATLYYGHTWEIDGDGISNMPMSFRLSHVELVSFSALEDAVSAWMGPSGFFSGV